MKFNKKNYSRIFRHSIAAICILLLASCASVDTYEAERLAKKKQLESIAFGFNKTRDPEREAQEKIEEEQRIARANVLCQITDADIDWLMEKLMFINEGMEIDISYEFYELEPNNMAELRHQIPERSPVCANHATVNAVGLVRPLLAYRLLSVRSASGCVVRRPVVLADITIVLPAIKETHQVSEDVKIAFKRNFKHIEDHENIHKNYAIQEAKELQQELERNLIGEPCEYAQNKAQDIYRKVREKASYRHKKFDDGYGGWYMEFVY